MNEYEIGAGILALAAGFYIFADEASRIREYVERSWYGGSITMSVDEYITDLQKRINSGPIYPQ